MANSREILKRRDSVSSIHKITSTMDMVATSRFKKAYSRAVGSRPYTDAMADMISVLSRDSYAVNHLLLKENTGCKRSIVLVITTNRGLCGGYNGAILDKSEELFEALRKDDKDIELQVVGKKGIQQFKYAGKHMTATYADFDEKVGFNDIEPIADGFLSDYTDGNLSSVHVVYSSLVSRSRYVPKRLQLLPFTPVLDEDRKARRKLSVDEFIFSPSLNEILDEMVPAMVRILLYGCFLDALVTEQIARMSAMQAATTNAEQMIEALSKQYNRLRQSQITTAMLDIIGGTEALK